MADVPYRPFNSVTPSGGGFPYQNVSASPDAFGAAEGRAVQGLGESITRNATRIGDALVHRQALVDENLATDANTEFMTKATALWGDYSQKTGKDAYTGYQDFRKSLDDLWNESVGSLKSDQAKQMFTRGSKRFYVAQIADGQGFANREFKAWSLDSSQGRADALANQASLAGGNPAQMNAFLAAGAEEIRKNRQTKGLPPEAVDADVRAYYGSTLNNIITEKSKDDPQGAMAMLQQYGPMMDPDSRAKAAATLRPIARDQEATALVNTAVGVPNNTGPRGSQAGGTAGFQNNVGNLRVSDSDWIGKGSPYNGFETFSTPEQGVAATVKNIQHIAEVHGGDVTIGQLIDTWAPASDHNDPTAYAATVAKAVGMDVDDAVPVDDPEKMTGIVKAMARVEKGSGADKIPDSAYTAGVNAALNGSPLANAGQPTATPGEFGGLPDRSTAVQAIVEATHGDPDLMAAALSKLNQRYALQDALTATARQQLADQLPDVMRAAQMGDQSVILPLDLMRKSGMSQEDFSRTVTQFDTSKRIGLMTQGLAFAPEEDLQSAMAGAQSLTGPIGEAIKSAAGDDQAMRLALQSGAISQIKALRTDRQQMLHGDNADPAAYVAAAPSIVNARDELQKATHMASVTNDPGIATVAAQDYAAAVLGQQESMGVAPEDRRVLSRDQAIRLGQALSPKPGQSGELAVKVIRDGAKTWGNAWGQIASEVSGSMSDVARVVAIMPVSQNHAAAKLVEAASAKKDVEKATAGMNSDIRESIGNEFGPFLTTFRGSGVAGIQEGSRIMQAGELLARSYAMDGASPKDAAAQAYKEIIGSQYDVSAGVRVPLPYDAGLIVRSGNTIVRGLTVDDVMPPGDDLGAGMHTGEQYLSSLKANHSWVNAPNGKGLVLMDQLGPVLDKNGNPLFRSWQQLIATEPEPADLGYEPMQGGYLVDPLGGMKPKGGQ